MSETQLAAPEVEKATTCTYLDIAAENIKPWQEQRANLVLAALNACHRIATINAQNPINPYSPDQERVASVKQDIELMQDIILVAEEIRETLKPPAKEIVSKKVDPRKLYTKESKLLEREAQQNETLLPFIRKSVPVNDPSSFQNLRITLDSTYHDLRNKMATVKGFFQMAERRNSPPNYTRVNEAFTDIGQYLKDIGNILKKEYPKDSINCTTVSNVLYDALARTLEKDGEDAKKILHFLDPSEEAKKTTVVWSKVLIAGLGENLAQNWTKANISRNETSPHKRDEPNILLVETRVFQDEGKKFLVIITEDRGTGFLDDKDGYSPAKEGRYKREKTVWAGRSIKGTGVGMAQASYELELIYGGRIIPQNITDETGNVIGARNIIMIPFES